MSTLNLQPHSRKGFTLFEVLIYIALFTFIVGAGVMSAYHIFDGTSRIDQNTRQEAELNFMLRKLDWALSGVIIEPDIDFPHDRLEVVRNGVGYEFYESSSDFAMTNLDTGDSYQLTSALAIDNLSFTRSTIDDPDQIHINITIDGEVLETITRYVRTD